MSGGMSKEAKFNLDDLRDSLNKLGDFQFCVSNFQNVAFNGDGDVGFHVLAAAGEIGEALNIIKKMWAGRADEGGELTDALAEELCDALLYIMIAWDRIPDSPGIEHRMNIVLDKIEHRLIQGDYYSIGPNPVMGHIPKGRKQVKRVT